MNLRKNLNDIFTVILVVCAILVTIILVKREFFNDNNAEEVKIVENWKNLLNGGQLIGEKNAPVKIIEFTDYQCPYCKIMRENLETIMNRYKDKISLIVYNFPVKSHVYAYKLAVAGLCAAKQNKFDIFYKIIFKYQKEFNNLNINNITQLIGLKDSTSFINCVKDREIYRIVDNEIEEGRNIGIKGTPTIIINGKMFVGSRTVTQLDNIINEFLN